ncbi:MAG: inositol monophosphatase family protein [Fimbriimonas sp.]|nr:inositol monophosphatase family protein [Fimbriimonas sp.]
MDPASLLLDELNEITRRAGEIAVKARESLKRELKPDGTVVTNGDRAVEEFLRPILSGLIPGSAVWGEEFGFEAEGSAGWWLVDPIDGTTNFAFGGPYWGVSIAYAKDDILELASIYLPDLNEMYLAEVRKGTTLNGRSISPIPAGPIHDEEIVSYSERLIRRYPKADLPGKMRCSGAFVVDGTFTATQRFRGLIGMGEKLYDVAASVLINQELGADIRYASGEPFLIADLSKDAKIRDPWLIFPQDSGFAI